MRRQFDNIPGLKDVGGYDFLKKNGVWPIYGTLDPATGKIVDKNGDEIKPEYGIPYKEDANGKVTIRGKKFKGFGTGDGKSIYMLRATRNTVLIHCQPTRRIHGTGIRTVHQS